MPVFTFSKHLPHEDYCTLKRVSQEQEINCKTVEMEDLYGPVQGLYMEVSA